MVREEEPPDENDGFDEEELPEKEGRLELLPEKLGRELPDDEDPEKLGREEDELLLPPDFWA